MLFRWPPLGQHWQKKLGTEYAQDPEFRKVFQNLRYPFELKNGLLYRDNRLWVPNGQIRMDLLYDYHTTPNTGHLGEIKTRHRIQPYFYWKSMRDTIHDYVNRCRICQKTKSRNNKPSGYLQPFDPPVTNWTEIMKDFIVPLPRTKNRYNGILNIVDWLSKMTRLIPIKADVTALEVAKLSKDNIYRHHGLPQRNISDRDRIFGSKFWKNLFRMLGTKLAPSTAYHPQTDGQTQIANREVEKMISAFANFRKNNWDEHLVDFEIAYN